MQSFAATSQGRQFVACAQVECREPERRGDKAVWHASNLAGQRGLNYAAQECGGPRPSQKLGSLSDRACYQSPCARQLAGCALGGGLSASQIRTSGHQIHQRIRLLQLHVSKLQRGRASCMLAVAQEGFSQAEGSTEELEKQLEPRKPPGDEDDSGVVIIGVRECNDGSVIFDFGTADERPEHDPLEAFIYGTALAEAGPSDSSAASTTSSEEQGNPEALGEPVRESDSVESDENTDSGGSSEPDSPMLRLRAGGTMLPHPAKVQKGGEDAFFCAQTNESSYIGVSDGVGGWATLGIDAGLYSRELMSHCERMAHENILPRSMLIRAHKMTKATGSATVMVARLQGNQLQLANLGDSGFLLVRDGEVALASTQMQHAFNFPFQIGSKGGDDPECAKDYEITVERGDLLVLGTDGLFDNLFEKEIAEAAVMLMSKGIQPQLASQHIAAFAKQRSLLKSGLSPFAVQADAAGYKHLGGKPDDVTVVIAFVE